MSLLLRHRELALLRSPSESGAFLISCREEKRPPRIESRWPLSFFHFFVDIPDHNSMVLAIERQLEANMLSEQLVVVLKSKAKLVDDQIDSITESEGWEIIRDIELLNRKKLGRVKSVQ
jgi:hypothetical protein